jgi:hypothetical protein
MASMVDGLISSDFSDMVVGVMNLLLVRQIFAVLLSVFVTAGLSLAVAQAGNVPMKMPMASGMTASGHSDFHDCDSCAAGKTKGMVCAEMCAASIFATLPQIAPMAIAEIMTTLAAPEDEFLIGSRSPPDPYPPQSADIG